MGNQLNKLDGDAYKGVAFVMTALLAKAFGFLKFILFEERKLK